MPGGRWVVLHVIQRHEKSAAQFLYGKGYEVFLPTYAGRSTKPPENSTEATPLFPGYVFCRGNEQSRGRMITTPGLIRIVSFGGKVAYLRDNEIAALKQMCSSGRNYGPHPFVQEGKIIEVVNGPLKGIVGTVVRMNKNNRVVITIDFLMKSVFAEINRGDILVSRSASAPYYEPQTVP